MHLRHGEVVIRTVKRHLTPYVLKLIGVAIMVIPIYFFLFVLAQNAQGEWVFYTFAGISFFVGIIIAIISLDYLLDKLMITNKRIVWVNWKSLFKKDEHEVELSDMQDIDTAEKGILAKLHIFDYGIIRIETAASTTSITFRDCPNPDGVKHFILSEMEK